eukprot:PhM_4_TR4597/c0_g2_i1/m.54750
MNTISHFLFLIVFLSSISALAAESFSQNNFTNVSTSPVLSRTNVSVSLRLTLLYPNTSLYTPSSLHWSDIHVPAYGASGKRLFLLETTLEVNSTQVIATFESTTTLLVTLLWVGNISNPFPLDGGVTFSVYFVFPLEFTTVRTQQIVWRKDAIFIPKYDFPLEPLPSLSALSSAATAFTTVGVVASCFFITPTALLDFGLSVAIAENECTRRVSPHEKQFVARSSEYSSWILDPTERATSQNFSRTLSNSVLLVSLLLVHACVMFVVVIQGRRPLHIAMVMTQFPSWCLIPYCGLHYSVVRSGIEDLTTSSAFSSVREVDFAIAAIAVIVFGVFVPLLMLFGVMQPGFPHHHILYDPATRRHESCSLWQLKDTCGLFFTSFRFERIQFVVICELTFHFVMDVALTFGRTTRSCGVQAIVVDIILLCGCVARLCAWPWKWPLLNITYTLCLVMILLSSAFGLDHSIAPSMKEESRAVVALLSQAIVGLHCFIGLSLYVSQRCNKPNAHHPPPDPTPPASSTTNPILTTDFETIQKKLIMNFPLQTTKTLTQPQPAC